jgi:hypothetical protein
MVQPDGLREVKGYIPWVGKVCGRELVEIKIVVEEFQWVMYLCFGAEVPMYLWFWGLECICIYI